MESFLSYPLALDLNELADSRSQKGFLELSRPLIDEVCWKGRYVAVQDVGFHGVIDVHVGRWAVGYPRSFRRDSDFSPEDLPFEP